MTSTIPLGAYGITITIGDPDPENPEAHVGAVLTSDLHEDGEDPEYRAAIDAVESLILAHAAAGVNVTAAAYVEGVETAVESIANGLG